MRLPACSFTGLWICTYILRTTIFTARLSYASAVLGVVILSVCPSVCPSSDIPVLCDYSKESTGDIFIPHERAILLVFCRPTVVGGQRPLPPLRGDQSDPPPSKIAHVDRFSLVTSQQ